MHGLITLLPEPHYTRVKALWDGLETHFGLNGIRATPYPHLSWNIAEDYERPQMDWAIAEIALKTPIFPVWTDGIGLFPAPVPVLYVKILRNPFIDALHRRLWERMLPITNGLSYEPDTWVPHITLAYPDLTAEQVPEVRDWLEAQEAYKWEVKINNICYIHEQEGQISDLQLNVPLQGPEEL